MVPLLLTLLALGAPAPGEEAAARSAAPAPFRSLAGKLAEVRLAERAATLQVSDGSIRLRLDRNTAIFLPGRQGTLCDLTAGEPVRASVAPDGLAYWIELRPRGVVPTGAAGEPAAPERTPHPAGQGER